MTDEKKQGTLCPEHALQVQEMFGEFQRAMRGMEFSVILHTLSVTLAATILEVQSQNPEQSLEGVTEEILRDVRETVIECIGRGDLQMKPERIN